MADKEGGSRFFRFLRMATITPPKTDLESVINILKYNGTFPKRRVLVGKDVRARSWVEVWKGHHS